MMLIWWTNCGGCGVCGEFAWRLVVGGLGAFPGSLVFGVV